MSKKYVIDLPDGAQYILINGASENHCYTRVEQVDDLEELNSDYINEHYGSLQDEAYKAGMNKAWGLAEDVIYNRGNVLDILHCATVGAAFDKYSAGQALDILRAYKKKQKDSIEVGDIVERYIDGKLDSKGIYLQEEDGYWRCLFDTGAILTTFAYPKGQFKKTGKHYDIQSILEAMRE